MRIEKTDLKGVYARELSGKQLIEFLEFTQSLSELTPSKNLEIACLLISMGVVDKDGNNLYTVETAKDLSYNDILLLSSKVIEISGMGNSNLKNAQKDSSATS